VGLYEALADFERNLIEQALLKAGGVQVIAAKLLKIGKSGLNQKIKKLGIDITRFAV
jgi:two-component system NtrC family response regulator